MIAGDLRQALQNAIVPRGSLPVTEPELFLTIEVVSYPGEVPELADGPDLGSGAAMRGGSSPPFPTS